MDEAKPSKRLPGFVHNIAPDPANRPESDFYKTPRVAVERFLDAEPPIPSPCWEPACGDGAISRVLEERGVRVFSSDLYDYDFGTADVDFLTTPPHQLRVRSVVTNPPFKRAQEFVVHALSIPYVERVAMLMRLLWLEGKDRRRFFTSTPLARVWVHSSRMNVSRRGQDWGDGGLGGMVAFAWYVWEPGHSGPPTLGWLP